MLPQVGWKVVGVLAGAVAAKASRSALDKGWAVAKGGEPPRNPADPGTSWADAVQWAVVSGVAVGLAKLVATRGAAGAWRRTTGHLPPGLQEVGN